MISEFQQFQMYTYFMDFLFKNSNGATIKQSYFIRQNTIN